MSAGHEKKVFTLEKLDSIIKEQKLKGKKIVQCHGCFDLIHPGHIRHLASAKKRGDVLVVTITSDRHVNKGPGRPIFNEQLRAETLASLATVDYVAINDAPNAVGSINIIRPHIYIKGNEFEDGKDLHGGIAAEVRAVAAVGGKAEFTDDITFSSTKLINNSDFFAPYPEVAKEFLRKFQKKFNFETIQSYFEKIKDYKVLVIGEAIIDEYHYVRTMNKSLKDPIITTRYENEESFAGGVLACANHVAGYCKNVDLITCLGKQDAKEEFIKSHLKPNVKTKFVYNPNAPTIVKRRFVDPAFLTKMFEVYYFDDKPFSSEIESDLLRYLIKVLPRYDLVIAVDYGHGFLTPAMRKVISEKSSFLALNTQTNGANYGFHIVTKYPKADYVSIDHLEARLALRKKDIAPREWSGAIRKIAGHLDAGAVAITLGHEGCLFLRDKEVFRVPVFSTRVVDRVGAGDAFLAITAPLVKAGLPAEALGFVGNAVGAVAVTIVGNKEAVQPSILLKSINTMLTR